MRYENTSGEINVIAGRGACDSLVIRFDIADRALVHEPEFSVLRDEIARRCPMQSLSRGDAAGPSSRRRVQRPRDAADLFACVRAPPLAA